MIHLIIWSKDQACQLQLLLDSIKKNAPHVFNISVIYSSSNSQFQRGYDLLYNRHPYIILKKEIDFYEDTLYLVFTSSNQVAFMCDDVIFYNQIPCSPEELEKALPRFINECFSFRLGLNTIVQNPMTGDLQPLLNKYSKIGNFIHWNCTLHHPLTNYGYPFSVDGHVYSKELLQELLPKLSFNNSTELESQLFQYRHRITYMSSFTKSMTVNICGKSIYPPEDLNERYLNNEIMLLDFDDTIIGCHQELSLKFGKYNG